MIFPRSIRVLFLCLATAAGSVLPAFAQQTGIIVGTATSSDGAGLPGVTVEAKSAVLPAPRSTITEENGDYRLPALPPGAYTVTFTLSGMATVTRQVEVQLALETRIDATLGIAGVTEAVEVTASAGLVDRSSGTLSNNISSEQLRGVPVGQQYRDLLKLIPGVQFSQDAIRGPSAGGSGQDNVYQFDGVNVTLPLFGTLSAEPASHDIAQVTVIRGAARAVDFDRAGGFTIDSVSKSGTNKFSGLASFQFQQKKMIAETTSESLSNYERNATWTTFNLGGPVVPEKVFFYASYFRPTITRGNNATAYGEVPEYQSTRNEGFGKVTATPTSSLLFNGSWRQSKRDEVSASIGQTSAGTTGAGNESKLQIGTADGSWVINSRSVLAFKYTHFANPTQGRPDHIADVDISTQLGTRLDLNALDTLGKFTVPAPIAGQAAFNTFVQPFIDRYGYIRDGVRTGSGTVGYYEQFDNLDFYRDAGQVSYNYTLGTGPVTHDLHAGYQITFDKEELFRTSNGWGLISVPGGRINTTTGTGAIGVPIYFQTAFQQQGLGLAPTIKSRFRGQTIEFNDTIRWNNFSFNVGLIASNDTLYGQGLREDANALSGFVAAPGNKYEMLNIGFGKMIQPRVGATWAYNGKDTIYASYAKYNPAASSLPRAASWDRNLATTINGNFDQSGVLINVAPVASSSGKLFVDDLTPRAVDEFLIGTARQFGTGLSMRAYYRYREGSHFWEDTNNTARTTFQPPDGIPRELYIPDLSQKLAQIGSGSTYVIAELDGAYTKFHEATLEAEYRAAKTFVRASYTWSHYYGNFDQDNSTTTNDSNIFIGSSFIGDGAGRQLWNFRDGDLRGDRPHLLKLYGFYSLNWNASVGAFFVAQSGQPWEMWSYEPYVALTTNTSDASRYAEPAGSRRSDAHAQLDVNYTQDIPLKGPFRFQIALDVFNLFDRQTGYNIDPAFHNTATFGKPRTFFEPRRSQIAARFQF
jgi:hypothetical protein